MLEAVLHSAEAVLVLFSIAFVGFETSRRGWYNEDSRRLMARLVNLCLPLFLFYNVTSKFTHEDLINVLQVAGLPFLTVGFNWLVSLAIVKMGWVRKEIAGAFIACFTLKTVESTLNQIRRRRARGTVGLCPSSPWTNGTEPPCSSPRLFPRSRTNRAAA